MKPSFSLILAITVVFRIVHTRFIHRSRTPLIFVLTALAVAIHVAEENLLLPPKLAKLEAQTLWYFDYWSTLTKDYYSLVVIVRVYKFLP